MMRSTYIVHSIFAALSCVIVVPSTPLLAEETGAKGVTIAIMDFDSKAPGNPDFGKQIAEILTIRLSMVDGVAVVDRSRIDDLIEEQKLTLRGLTDQQQATQVGKLLGAKLMVFGKVFPVGQELYVTMKLVGVETGQLKGAIAKGKASEDLSVILDRATEELIRQVETQAVALLPKGSSFEKNIESLAIKLKGKKLPTVAVIVPETHVNREIPDPAVETELIHLLKKVGFEVLAMDRAAMSGWARDFDPKNPRLPKFAADAELVFVGEAFSEYAGTFRGLVSCSGRAEVTVVDRKTGKVISVARTTERAVDLSENVAAKTALQKCGHVVGLQLITELADHLSGKTE